ncbi:MAG: glutamine--tRNA ligase/YqeY domain fusion protein [Bdellovibrionales bacterium]|nr:glutamine--tRNA ligase/YqeY domain fusion protein [Bdellovibrionales bacterium]
MSAEEKENNKPGHFINTIIDKDRANGKHGGKVHTRFPPEPNGYLHIGHAKSICLNFGLAEEYGGPCNLRFDDTNPETEKMEYIEAIKKDIKWLGFNWSGEICYSSDYFQKLYELALQMIDEGIAYVCELTPEQTREYRGTLTEPGKNSPFRDRTPQENRELFEKMKAGEVEEGKMVLRAKIDMSASNINLRDPIMYRIKKAPHPRTGSAWNIYPMYDWTHGLSDSFEGITHSICTLEFQDHRPLYDWYLEATHVPHRPQQIEFARLNLDYTVMSKRKLIQLVEDKHVHGWDDPRMPTIIGMRRRGYSPKAIREFCDRIGVTKKDSCITMSTLESVVREDLDETSPRAMAVLDPIKVTITNFPEGEVEKLSAQIHPKKEEMGRREIPFTKDIYIDREDFMENPPKGYFRLSPGGQVRLRYAYVITCDEVIKDDQGHVVELKCTYNSDTGGGKTPEGMKKVKGIIHWVSATESLKSEVRLYDRLFNVPNPLGAEKDYLEYINPESLIVKKNAYVELSMHGALMGEHVQFERVGFFCVDYDTTEENLVFNRTVTLKDAWLKQNSGKS